MELPPIVPEPAPHGFTKLGGKPHVPSLGELQGSVSPEIGPPASSTNPKAFGAQIYDQGQRPACGAHAGAFFAALRKDIAAPGISPRFTWIDMKEHGSDTNPSDGVNMTDIFNSLHGSGASLFEPLENDVLLDDEDYASPTALTAALITGAKAQALSTASYVNKPTFEQLKQHIDQNGPQIILIQAGNTLWTAANGTTSWAAPDLFPLRPPSPVIDGHFVVAHSYNKDYIYFANSFGKTWGAGGHGWFAQNYMPYVLEMGTAN